MGASPLSPASLARRCGAVVGVVSAAEKILSLMDSPRELEAFMESLQAQGKARSVPPHIWYAAVAAIARQA